ncbi:hypothetical protein [Streptomyces sp. C8S0]|uniref:hypothetical protein n=1 Tax=Streptomyces sp. C8S0 TaxID=2585716 RepID=UPI001D04199F|nr:hypothetical protein [Streptomyces sp. C8S0]
MTGEGRLDEVRIVLFRYVVLGGDLPGRGRRWRLVGGLRRGGGLPAVGGTRAGAGCCAVGAGAVCGGAVRRAWGDRPRGGRGGRRRTGGTAGAVSAGEAGAGRRRRTGR